MVKNYQQQCLSIFPRFYVLFYGSYIFMTPIFFAFSLFQQDYATCFTLPIRLVRKLAHLVKKISCNILCTFCNILKKN